MYFNKIFLVLFISILVLQGCLSSDDSVPDNNCVPIPAAEQAEVIDQYIDQNGLTMQTTATGLRYSIDVPGTGDDIVYGDTIQVDYRGTLLNGAQFDAGSLGPLILSQGSFIPGFEEGLQLYNEGAEGTLIIPGELGYGCFPPVGSPIGLNEVLVFDITIVQVGGF